MTISVRQVWIVVVIFLLIALGSYGFEWSSGLAAFQKACIILSMGMALTMMARADT